MTGKRSKKPEKKKSKVFFYKDDKTMEIKAGGILFIRGKTINEVLIQKVVENNGKIRHSDFGGKINDDDDIAGDITIEDTIARELHEETNEAIMSKSTKEYLSIAELHEMINENIRMEIYIQFAKYLLKIVYFDDDKYEIDFNRTGTHEKKDDIKRVVEWITYDEFIKYYNSKSLHPRMDYPSILNFFKIKTFKFK
jgi:ADP-ribose pyrophosphatase YjhB (NUDIX family)